MSARVEPTADGRERRSERSLQRRASIDSFSPAELSSSSFTDTLFSDLSVLRLMFRLSLCDSPAPARMFLYVLTVLHWIFLACENAWAGNTWLATFYATICIFVYTPLIMMLWFLWDNHRGVLIQMLASLRSHSPAVFARINLGAAFFILVSLGAGVLISLLYIFIDRPRFRDDLYESPTSNLERIGGCLSGLFCLFSLAQSGFTLVFSYLLITFAHFKECEHLTSKILDEPERYIGSGDALYDLNVVALRVQQTSHWWAKVVIPTVVGSSVCFFTMVLAFFQSHMSWSTYPGMSIMLPALWLPGFASGVVTGRFIWIYSAATARSPVLLRAMAGEETANLGNDDAGGVKRFVSVKGSLESSSSLFNAKPVVDPASSKGEAEGEWKNDDR
ncbi:hypothetical protein TeGR_g9639, partial [Tetraparma gracilis]